MNAGEQPYALVGALAVGVHASERATKDIDFAVAVRGESAALSLLAHLKGTGRYEELERNRDPNSSELRSVVFAATEDQTLAVDLLFSTCGIEAEVVEAAEPVELVEGVRVDVATRGHLIAMKTLSLDDVSRPRDRGDLADLLKGAKPDDLAQARRALRLMDGRGFGYLVGKDDLLAELDQACKLYAPDLSIKRGLSLGP